MDIKRIKRDADGLIEGVEYKLTPNGKIDWRKMIDPQFLVPNRDNFIAQSKPVPTSIEGLEDKDLLILLGGIEALAELRGFTDMTYVLTSPAADAVFATCKMCWLPNFETENLVKCTSGVGDANPFNTKGVGRQYLGPIAENRAFVRCVRKFLRIKIIGKDEIEPTKTEGTEETAGIPEASPAAQVQQLMTDKNVSFDMIKAKLISMGVSEAKDYSSLTQISKPKLLELIIALKNKKS